MDTVAKAKDNFIPWMGWMRVVAMLMVCVTHAGDPLSAFGAPSEKWWVEVYGSFVRPCVPLFVMLTGALLLPVKEDFGGIFRKRILRVVYPFLFWTGVYAALPWLLHTLGISVEVIQRIFFPFASPLHVDAASIVRTFFLSLLQFNQYAVQLWYIYVLIGLYLFMPILSAWLREATLRAKVTFLVLWGCTLLLWEWPLLLDLALRTSYGAALLSDYVVRFLGADSFQLAHLTSYEQFPLLGMCDWNLCGGLFVFTGYVGYLVLGHLLREVELSLRKTLLIALPLLGVGYGIVLGGTHWIWQTPGMTWKAAEYFWYYGSFPVAMMTAACFLLLKKWTWGPPLVVRLLKDFSHCGFGIFCAHYVLVTGVYYLLDPYLPTVLLVPCAATLGLLLTWCILSHVDRFPKVHKIIG